jgi:tetratricopeptide (TPR) repeat protein
MSLKFFAVLLVIVVLGAVGISAQQASTEEPAPVSTAAAPPNFTVASLPPSTRLAGLSPVYQQVNRCSSAALTIQLSYFGYQGSYDDTIRFLNPHAEDVAVRLDEMAQYAELQGLRAVARIGGTLDLLRMLVGNGFPVLIENVYYDGPGAFQDWMAHNRVVMGYDDALQTVYVFDSLLGNGADGQGRAIPYAEIDERWKAFNRDYLVLYRPEEEERIRAILGDQWDTTANAQWALEQSQAELNTERADSFTLFNAGSSLVELGRYEEAADYFDQARALGLPWRMLWYQYGPFEAYYHTGRYDDVLQLAHQVIADISGVEEAYYYAGLAYEAQGDTLRARSNYEVAVMRNANFAAARAALAQIRGEATATPQGENGLLEPA